MPSKIMIQHYFPIVRISCSQYWSHCLFSDTISTSHGLHFAIISITVPYHSCARLVRVKGRQYSMRKLESFHVSGKIQRYTNISGMFLKSLSAWYKVGILCVLLLTLQKNILLFLLLPYGWSLVSYYNHTLTMLINIGVRPTIIQKQLEKDSKTNSFCSC